MPECGCIAHVNAQLAPLNARLDTALHQGKLKERQLDVRVRVATKKLDRELKSQTVELLASFCPFCGICLDDQG